MALNQEDWKDYLKSEELHQFANDPDEDPFRSKYQGRIVLKNLLLKLELLHLTENSEKSVSIRKSALACVLYKLAINYVDTEERPEGEKTVLEILQLLQNHEQDREIVSIYVAAKNYLGYIYCARSDYENSLVHLKKSEQCFHEFKTKNTATPWELSVGLQVCCEVLNELQLNEESLTANWSLKFEQLHTYTLFYLAQLYKNLNEFAKAANYCQQTLERQLEYQDYDPVEWALNAATLSQYYIGKAGGENFPQAWHCLAAAMAVIDKASDTLKSRDTSHDDADLVTASERQSEKIEHCKADVYRCSAKYGLSILEVSRDKFMARDSMEVEETAPDAATDAEDINLCSIFQIEHLSKYENEIKTEFVTNFAEAREVFLKVQTWLNKAKSFYVFNDYATDYVEIMGDLSRSFKFLVFFEHDIDRKCKMHKRRLDMLDATLKELNPQFYIILCRQLIFELAEISNEMLDLKMELAEERDKGNPNVHQISKINILAQQGQHYFQMFLDSFKDANNEMPIKFEHNAVRPVCLAHFYIGRLYGKFLTSDPRIKYENLQHSLDNYRWIVNYCETSDPTATDLVRSEYEVCKDMVHLYPMKMERLRTTFS